ncbi:DUF4897 domain-containing protein [Natronoarchaeum sp. GCM10025321]|uniref:DUF4897 domain-containing protein n=1 Tax=Natronoarchaeum sp. GCM10025321 TaxID=3252684 RepID=UPI0036157FF3
MDPSERTTGRRIVAVGIAVLLVTTLVAGSLAAGAAADQRSQSIQQDGTQAPVAQEEFDADDVRLTVDVDDEGTATWTVEYWKRLDDDESTTAFESIETDVEENPQEYVDEFAASMDGTVASATNSTGREMAANDYTVSTRSESIPQEYGVLTYSFEWSGFAAVDGERLEIGDAISGFFLDDQTRLVVAWPGEYELVDVQPEPTETREGSVLWQGSQTSFVGDEPRVVVSTDPGAADALGEESGLPLVPLGAGLTGAVLVVILWFLYTRGLSDKGGDGTSAADNAASDAGTVEQRQPTPAAAAESDPAAAGQQAAVPDDADAPDADADESPPSELLSNEERVVRLLEQHGGRLKQQQVVGELEWTDAKTSQVIGALREEGTVETFRIGRENVVRLPEEGEEGSL